MKRLRNLLLPLVLIVTLIGITSCGDLTTSTSTTGGEASSTTTTTTTTTPVVETFKVTFETNGGSTVSEETVDEGETLNKPTDPTKDGFKFIGWYTDVELTKLYSFDTPVSSSFTLYAKFEQDVINDKVTVSFMLDATEVYETKEITKGDVVEIPSAPVKTGYSFVGWFESLTDEKAFDFTSTITNSISLYAKFEQEVINDKVTVSFMLDTTEVYETKEITKGDVVAIPSAPVKTGYSFVGWFESLTDEKAFDFTSTITNSISLYAKFEQEVVNLEFDFGVYNEGAYITWDKTVVLKDDVSVTYTLEGMETSTKIDTQLVRNTSNNKVRADILGLPAGTHTISVVKKDGTVLFSKLVEIEEIDRSGYAHFNYSNGIGGYKDDGTLKDDAIVIYVTDENKNTVTASIDGTVYTGLSAILQNQSKSDKPLVVRIIGTINAATWNVINYGNSGIDITKVIGANGKALTEALSGTSSQKLLEDALISGGYNSMSNDLAKGITKLNGLTNQISYSSGEFDSYYNMLDVKGAQNVTVEGVGTDAILYQFGFTWKNCSYIEVRNLTFDDYTEDACSFEGPDDSTTLEGFTTGHIWLHNNTFNEGKNNWDVCPEQDKHEGDGATDFKKNAFITLSYNHYYKNHKTGLVGGGDSQHTASITFHHNYYEECSSRLPLGRQANMHMYNNYYYKSSGTNMSLRAGAYAFIEACYFEETNNPIEVKANSKYPVAAAKVYNCEFVNVTKTNNGTVVTSREEIVTNGNLYGTTFDTNSTIFYYDSVNNKSDVKYLTDAKTAKDDCINYAGVLK